MDNTIKKETIILILMLLIPVGIIVGEYKTCSSLNGEYNWDFGTCKIK